VLSFLFLPFVAAKVQLFFDLRKSLGEKNARAGYIQQNGQSQKNDRNEIPG